MKTYRLLIADDEESVQRILTRICHSMNWHADTAADGQSALALMEENEYQIFTVDVNMPGPSGLDLSRKILERYDSPAILILTGYAEITQAVEATKEGVYNYIQKDNVEISDIREQLMKAANYHENLLRSNQARKQRETEIQNTETASKQFQAVFDLSSDMTLIAKANTMQITDCNAAACDRLGYTRSELLQIHLTNFVPTITSDNVHELFEVSEQGYVKETTVQTKNNESIPIDISYTHVCLPHGEFVSVMMRDISERKEMQAQILQERNLLHLLMDNIPDSIFFKDAKLKYTCINQAYASKLNLSSPANAVNKSV
jgi:PAS domain S-box-containing protein